jgi:hypothetical protein
MRPAVIVSLSAITLAACAGPVLASNIVQDQVESGYDHGSFVAAAHGKQFNVTVLVGDVNAAQRPDIERAILSGMQAAGAPGVRTTFVASSDSARDLAGYRLVVAIDPGGTTSAEDLCAASPKLAPVSGPHSMHIAISFCRGEDLLSTATAITSAPWQDQETLKRTMGELMLATLPTAPPMRIEHPPAN